MLKRFLSGFVFATLLTPIGVGAAFADKIDDARKLYLQGDYGAALKIIEPAARAGDPEAQNILADAYDDGNGKKQSARLAQKWFRKAADQGLDKAQFNMGLFYLEGRKDIDPDPAQAISYFERAMQQDYAHAYYERARMMRRGQGGEVDPKSAAPLLQKALDLGLPEAGNALAELYLAGEGVAQDRAQARLIYGQAAQLGYPISIGNLGLMHELGYGGPVDLVSAHAAYQEAVRLKDANAAINLGVFLSEQPGYWNDPVRGYAWCLWGVKNARDDQRDSFSQTCDGLRDGLDQGARKQARALAARL